MTTQDRVNGGRPGNGSTITRKSLATEWEREDAIIESANGSKRDGAKRYRAQLAAKGWSKEDVKAELEAFRKAFARARQITKHGVDAVEEADARVEEILIEIRGSNAPRATRVEIIEEFTADPIVSGVVGKSHNLPDHDAETGEIIEQDSQPATDPKQSTAAATEGDVPERPSPSVTNQESLSAIVGDQGPADGDDKGTSPAGAEGDTDRQLNTREGAPATGGDDAPPASSVVQFPAKKQWKHADKPHPDCLNGTVCGGFSNLGLCPQCKEAAAKGQVA